MEVNGKCAAAGCNRLSAGNPMCGVHYQQLPAELRRRLKQHAADAAHAAYPIDRYLVKQRLARTLTEAINHLLFQEAP